ncbi:DEAD/DEAH box helicase [Paenibacillus sp. NEAU-GSW1]|uniref:DEAD/DEAH box helicase n=1 Tax=Paenibacillus sp. NEAU-GSW1 TaxID=2682486 RepID=UPI0012E1F140|nr:DEAD/DEAH box helicase [Paenibacillus sp. NEAU-GSW1]MUT68811.1 DEAD/DEAH box helicase [Paenibacillus sp. NEAU-GSW1]
MEQQSATPSFHPAIEGWFRDSFGEATDVQQRAWQAIAAKAHTLIAAPTGSGKTLAALLPCLDSVVRSKAANRPAAGKRQPSAVRIVYITPLKALNNDIYDHLEHFIKGIDAAASESDLQWPGLSCAVRTGDTTGSQRAAMLRRPPDVLITTPESLYILLTSEKGRGLLKTAEFVIVDEIHQLAADRRGAHLSLSLERLSRLSGGRLQRIGVSATQKPLNRVARFLGGWSENHESGQEAATAETHQFGYWPRYVTIVESLMEKRMDVRVTMPDHSVPMPTRESVWFPILDRLFELMTDCRSVLLFVNSRRLCERLCLRLNDHAGYEMARAHHGSMAKERRLEVERMLKAGELRCIVATSSLELGIDVGHVDFVIQLDSPLDAAAGIQRIGRAGHAVGSVSRGRIIARHRGVLPEIAVLSKQIAERDIEPIDIPENKLDVLSQHTVSIVAGESISLDCLHRLIAGSDSYRNFTRSGLEDMVKVLSGLYPFAKPLLDLDRENGKLSKRKNTSIAALTGAGTIPSSSSYPVHHIESRVHLGELDEEFVLESRVGDVFQLGTSSWMIRRVDKDRIYVSEAGNSFSEIPFWRTDGTGRSYALGRKVGEFMGELEQRIKQAGEYDGEIIEWLSATHFLDSYTAEQLISLARSQLACSELPTDSRIVIEHYRDVMNQTHVILHNPFGRIINRTWLLAIERQFEKLLPYRLYGNAKDNGIEFVIPEWDPSWLQSIWQVVPENVEPLLLEGLMGSPLLAIAFRHIAETSLLLSRGFSRTPLWQKRLRSEELLRDALPFADRFPYLTEAMRECLHVYLDIDRLRMLLEQIRGGSMTVVVRETEYPSPLATQFLMDYVSSRIYEGDGLDASVQMGLLNVSKELAGKLFGRDTAANAVSATVLESERRRMEEPEQPVRSPEDLWKLLKRRGDMSTDELIQLTGKETVSWLESLCQSGKALQIEFGASFDAAVARPVRWICSDEAELYDEFPCTSASVTFIVGRYAEHQLSFNEQQLRERYPELTLAEAERLIDQLAEQGVIVQAPFAESKTERIWTGRGAAARMIRLSINEARKLAEPAQPMRWCAQMALQQHALNGSQLKGGEGLLAVIERMQGLFLPLSLWETVIFPARLKDYRKEEMDQLCATGEIVWFGNKQTSEKEGKIAFFLAESRPLFEPYIQAAISRESSCSNPKLLDTLKANGASFLTKLSREAGQLPTETLNELLELAWEGHVSNDQFAPLRLAAGKKGKDWARSGSGQGRWYWTGSLITVKKEGEREAAAQLHESSAAHWVSHLLGAYGLVTKELAVAYTPYSWDKLLPLLNRLEEWGTITRGIFVDGAITMQFTTLELARSIHSSIPLPAAAPITLLSAVDPANPFGLMLEWPDHPSCAFARKPGNFLAFNGDKLLYWIENNGKRIYSFEEAEEQQAEHLHSIIGELLRRQRMNKLVIEKWNGADVTTTAAGAALERLGAERDRKSLVLWLSQFKSKAKT